MAIANDPISGPIPRDEFKALVSAPFGEAEKVIRKFDPLWHRAPDEKIKWRVKFTMEATMVGYATVEASSEPEAEALANDISDASICWDHDSNGRSIIEEITPL